MGTMVLSENNRAQIAREKNNYMDINLLFKGN